MNKRSRALFIVVLAAAPDRQLSSARCSRRAPCSRRAKGEEGAGGQAVVTE
ncbi:hypothetical protein NE857_08835 [Nocardiopsis exhalans]|uniref:Uncharacterized protein n=1 Tax=Nocardiopsis exhalans TaxID=163604 RepID=A0ABY5DBH5_9ACTN|nr:hypothetical protein [Nocardiopsis exhalans]USY21689.1 hypothetical protein NE857_08835 [Nocardiopsis exhalans]